MKQSYAKMLKQFAVMAEEGKFGDSIQAARMKYDQLPAGMATMLMCVQDAYTSKHGVTDELFGLRDLFCQNIIVTYRDAAGVNSDVASALLQSLIQDYPTVPESCLAPRFCTLAQAALNFREVAQSTNRLILWQHMTALVLAYHEFINGLLAYMIPCIRCALSKNPDPAFFAATLSNKMDQLKSLTGGENGHCYLISRIIRPRLRNAIAHGTIWPDVDAAIVRYTEGSRNRKEYEMDLLEFGALAMTGSHLIEPYLAAIGTITVMEDGTDFAKQQLPPHLVKVFSFKPSSP